MIRLIALLIALVVSPLVLAQQPPASNSSPAGPRKLQACQVIARVDNQVVLVSDVLWQVNMIIADNINQIPPDQLDETRQQIIESQLRQYIDTKLIYADFRREAQMADMGSIRKQLDEPFYSGGTTGDQPGTVPGLMKMVNATSMTELEVKLAQLGTSLTERKEAYVEQAIVGTWVQNKVKVDKPTYAQLSEYYQEHLEEYSFPTQVKWEELSVSYAGGSSRQAAQQKIVEAGNLAFEAAQKNPAAGTPIFAELAPKYSDGFNASEGGLYDWTTKGSLVDTKLDDAIFSLPVGALSPIIDSGSALHIVRVVERREEGSTPFADVQDEIRKKMMNEQFNTQVQDFISQLRRKTRIWTIYSGDTTAEAFLTQPGQSRR
ncbi:peptidylprolyl isomerase [Aeoliella mucimassa]|uniref:peptidylprolyl isomerase n=1 Tax=Aeoliella mucimassa TaxID=2527972 RepID=UPI0011A5DB2A|nr:peptidylprolyl isomerase [Aeoliella mucimassa]